ncbi:AMP-binding protein [Xylanimonas ulmi]|uniref:O-succinylbenzoic acid--CoA ligase n=1 Tax=Xylanimonas ulmi TaxID=228973 RepID=A0A4Q7M9Z9_9MICO|nr:AMP-binding protein [Xylanibacterium ulmi]RZS63049.1 O-succinylbenzoic acid--CoA ligase [Xylanibacterium ulmi]
MDHTLPDDVDGLARRLRAALDGGPAVSPLPRLRADAPPAGTALVVRTSGSTGAPREVALTAAALRASATATHDRLGGPGRWVLTLPATHIAGLQVLVRAALAADEGVPDPLVAAEPGAHFTPDGLAALLRPALADGVGVHISLVPTQLHRVLAAADDGAGAGLDALSRCASVLVGGAATAPALFARSRAAGVPVVRTYGMSETAGGCVYDGVPLAGVRLRLTAPTGSGAAHNLGRPVGAGGALGNVGADAVSPVSPVGVVGVVEIAGPTLALGYLGDPDATAEAFRADACGPEAGTRWFRTSDLGSLAATATPDRAARDESARGGDGSPAGDPTEAVVLSVLGRADDVVVTGGVNVAPATVEAALADLAPAALGLPAVEPCVVGVPDDEWGQALVAVVAAPGRDERLVAVDADALARVRAAVAARLGAPSAPRRVYVTGALPLRGPGKVDRRAVARAAEAAGH